MAAPTFLWCATVWDSGVQECHKENVTMLTLYLVIFPISVNVLQTDAHSSTVITLVCKKRRGCHNRAGSEGMSVWLVRLSEVCNLHFKKIQQTSK